MKYLFIIVAFFLLSFSWLAQWEVWYCEEGRFIVNIPHTFLEKNQKLDTEWGEIEMKHYYLDDRNRYSSNLFYMISYSDYPSEWMHQDSIEVLDAFFDATIQNSAKAVGGEIIYAQKNFEDESPNALWRINYERGTLAIRSKAILHESRLYILKVFYNAQKSKIEDVNRFFDSFEINSSND